VHVATSPNTIKGGGCLGEKLGYFQTKIKPFFAFGGTECHQW
jgi:hypothetical protein